MTRRKSYARILEPGTIGRIRTRNRIIKSGAGMLMWHEDDVHMREEVQAHYERFARGGVGLVIVEAVTVDYPWGARYRNRYRIDEDRFIPGLAELADVIHRHDCPTFLAVNHDGPWQVHWGNEQNPLYPGPPVAASPTWLAHPSDHHNEQPRALTVPEIEGIVEKFAAAALRARKAGFDGVDINAASSHLFHNFLSPFWNKREDDYGGSIRNRARLLTDTIRAMKDRAGRDFPVSIILNGIEIGLAVGAAAAECFSHEDSRAAARLAEAAGADAIQVRSHWIGRHVPGFLPDLLFYPEPPVPLRDFPQEYDAGRKGAGANIRLASGIKSAVNIPVTVVGRMSPDLGEETLQQGLADFIAMNRRLHADPELPNKLADGRPEEIAPCTGCTFCLGGQGRCRINGLAGTTHTTVGKAEKSKKVVVVGSGPAGMEAARVSALRGHQVVLLEKTRKPGGLLPLAAVVKGPHPEDLPAIIRYFTHQLGKLGVTLRPGTEADVATIRYLHPDVVFLATGGLAAVPDIRGIERPSVVSGAELHRRLKFFSRFLAPETLRRLSRIYMPIGRRVVIIGGGVQGCELAEFLLKRGRTVTVVDRAEEMGEGLVMAMKEQLFRWFEEKGVPLVSGVREYVEISDKGLVFVDREGRTVTLEADTIIPALPLEPNPAMLKELEDFVPEVYLIGDCRKPQLIVDAVGSALRTAMTV